MKRTLYQHKRWTKSKIPHSEKSLNLTGSADSKKKPIKKKDHPTIGVMFLDQTAGGGLAKKLHAVEDRQAKTSGYRIRMVEMSGTQLGRLLTNTNPWAGQECGRQNCDTCEQGDERRTARRGTSSMRAAVPLQP